MGGLRGGECAVKGGEDVGELKRVQLLWVDVEVTQDHKVWHHQGSSLGGRPSDQRIQGKDRDGN